MCVCVCSGLRARMWKRDRENEQESERETARARASERGKARERRRPGGQTSFNASQCTGVDIISLQLELSALLEPSKVLELSEPS